MYTITMIEVSFCIPTYNREKSVQRCLRSLLAQTARNDEYEIIVVDDCSTDNTVNVVNDLLADAGFENSTVVVLEQNSGNASTPRNEAVKHARGEYLFFLDSDDYVDAALVENLYKIAKENNSDVVYPKYKGLDGRGVPGSFSKNGSRAKGRIVEDQLVYALSVLKGFKRSEWNRLDLKFDPKVTVGEDMLVTIEFLVSTKVHSILADRDYYFAAASDEVSLVARAMELADTFQNYSKIFDIILNSDIGDETLRLKIAARFANRINNVGRGHNNKYLELDTPEEEAKLWIEQFQNLYTHHFPQEAEQYLNQTFSAKIKALRKGDLVAAQEAVRLSKIQD